VATEGDQAHGFDAASHYNAVAAGTDTQISLDNGLKAGGTEAVHRDAGNLDRQLGAQSGKTGDIPALLRLRLGTTEDYVINLCPVEGWNPLQSAVQHKCGEIIGASGRKSTPRGAAYRGTNGADDDGFRHGGYSLTIQRIIHPFCKEREKEGNQSGISSMVQELFE
jgi:hypothetical protein